MPEIIPEQKLLFGNFDFWEVLMLRLMRVSMCGTFLTGSLGDLL